LLLIFAAVLVAQTTNGQASHEVVPYWDFSTNPTDWGGFFPEEINDGAIIYEVNTRIDNSGGNILHIRSLPCTLKGAEGGKYKYHDLVARGDWYWPDGPWPIKFRKYPDCSCKLSDDFIHRVLSPGNTA
jgi:hypothetical protein